MKIIDKKIGVDELGMIEEETFFSDMFMIKAVVDIDRELIQYLL